MMQAAILAGGLGTRLRSVIADRPKVLAPVASRRFLSYLLDQLAEAGLEEVVLCTGYLGEQVKQAFGERWRKLRLQYSQEAEPMGTAGALRLALPYLSTSDVLVLNGDSYCDVRLRELMLFHIKQRATATIALTEVPDVSRYGAVHCDVSGAITDFAEKGSVGPGSINAGIYVLSHRLLESIPENRPTSLERDSFERLVGNGLYGYAGGRRFIDIGLPSSLEDAQAFFASTSGSPRRRYVLLDRDGTINVERHYLSRPEQLEILPGVTDGMKRMRNLGLGLAIISNQSAMGRGLFGIEQLDSVHNRLRDMLGQADIALDGIYYCPHVPEAGCSCRKPEPGMVARAASELGFNPREAFVIGDKLCDIDLGYRVGATTLLVKTGYGKQTESSGVRANYTVDTLADAADVIHGVLAHQYATAT